MIIVKRMPIEFEGPGETFHSIHTEQESVADSEEVVHDASKLIVRRRTVGRLAQSPFLEDEYDTAEENNNSTAHSSMQGGKRLTLVPYQTQAKSTLTK